MLALVLLFEPYAQSLVAQEPPGPLQAPPGPPYQEQTPEQLQELVAPIALYPEGQHNGLYWKVSDGEPQSPIGPLVASAIAEGYAKGKAGPPTPYRGYLFHILTRQGTDAPGGAKNYVANGKMTEGFAFVAYPVDYRSSGVMTFIVDQDGVVYQKDLGNKTEELGKSMHQYNPDSSWGKAEEEPAQTASWQKVPHTAKPALDADR